MFKDRSLVGIPRYIIETIDPDFGFRNEQIFSGVWYNKKTVLEIAQKKVSELDAQL